MAGGRGNAAPSGSPIQGRSARSSSWPADASAGSSPISARARARTPCSSSAPRMEGGSGSAFRPRPRPTRRRAACPLAASKAVSASATRWPASPRASCMDHPASPTCTRPTTAGIPGAIRGWHYRPPTGATTPRSHRPSSSPPAMACSRSPFSTPGWRSSST